MKISRRKLSWNNLPICMGVAVYWHSTCMQVYTVTPTIADRENDWKWAYKWVPTWSRRSCMATNVYQVIWEAAVEQVLPRLLRSKVFICSALGCQCLGVFPSGYVFHLSYNTWRRNNHQKGTIRLSLSESTWARTSPWVRMRLPKMPATCYVSHTFCLCHAPKNPQRKLLWHCTNPQNSRKLSPSKVSRYTVWVLAHAARFATVGNDFAHNISDLYLAWDISCTTRQYVCLCVQSQTIENLSVFILCLRLWDSIRYAIYK